MAPPPSEISFPERVTHTINVSPGARSGRPMNEIPLEPEASKLAELDDEAIRVDPQGRLVDWADRPGHEGRPVFPQLPGERRKTKRDFLPSEEHLLLVWCSAAAEQGILAGSSVFEQLECLRPNRSWQAYESKWRQGGLNKRSRPALSTSSPFPNLRRHTDPDPPCDLVENSSSESSNTAGPNLDSSSHGQNSLHPATDGGPQFTHLVAYNDAQDAVYSDFRVDIHHNLLQRLNLSDGDMFLELLELPWFVEIYSEFVPSLQDQRAKDEQAIETTGKLPRTPKGKAHHRFKIEQALAQSSRYTTHAPDKHLWKEDDHDVRFMVLVMRAAQRQGNAVWNADVDHGVEAFSERAFWLMLWLRWVYKPVLGQSDEMKRQRRRKEEWLAILNASRNRHLDRRHAGQTASPQIPDPSQNSSTKAEPAVGPSIAAAAALSTDVSRPSGKRQKLIPPEYSMPLSRSKAQQRSAFWLTEDAFVAFEHQRNQRLADWGVTAQHSATCVLVPQELANVSPSDTLDNIPWNTNPGAETARLRINLGDTTVAWARAEAWFQPWPTRPRRGIDLDQFLTGPDGIYEEMHGSHLCHQGFCIVPTHIEYENSRLNRSRTLCSAGAKVLRGHGMEIPPHCVTHKPPCLLQNAVLTIHEALLVQLSVFREAYGISAPREEPVLPSDHPSWYSTFEYQLPTTLPLSSLTVDPAHLIGVHERARPRLRNHRQLDPFTVRCCFCAGVQRVWQSIAAYWSHVKILHEDVARTPKLAAITRSARDYLQWIKARAANYERDNASTWLKLQQATTDSFDWDTVMAWRLPQDRHNERLRDAVPEGAKDPFQGFPHVMEDDHEFESGDATVQ